MKDRKKEINELLKKLDEMLKENKPKEETESVINRLEKLLKEYLEED